MIEWPDAGNETIEKGCEEWDLEWKQNFRPGADNLKIANLKKVFEIMLG
jgi:hypothetical protein